MEKRDPMKTCKESVKRMLLVSEAYSDCKFLVGEKKETIPANKILLALASEVFEKILYKEGANIIEEPDVKSDTIKSLLFYVTTRGRPSLKDFDANLEFWYVACKYHIKELSACYTNMLSCHISIENCLTVFGMCQKARNNNGSKDIIREVESCCEKCYRIKTVDVLNTTAFQELNSSYLEVLVDQDMKITEVDLFSALKKYATAKGWTSSDLYYSEDESANTTDENNVLKNTIQDIRKAIKNIRFRLMTLDEFDSGPGNSGYLTESEAGKIRRSLQNRSNILPPGFSDKRKRYEKLPHDIVDILEDRRIHVITMMSELPCISKDILVTSFNLLDTKWQVILQKCRQRNFLWELILFCDGNLFDDGSQWKRYAQLDIRIASRSNRDYDEYEHDLDRLDRTMRKGQFFLYENIPWFCFQREHRYSRCGRQLKLDYTELDIFITVSASLNRVQREPTDSKVRVRYDRFSSNYSPVKIDI